jgi:iron complex transport system ATP-binding protein
MLQIDALTVAYGDYIALREVHLKVKPGEIMALIGPNGAGKTTLIRTVSGLMEPDRGSITIDGEDIIHLSTAERARILAVVPQARQLGGAFSVRQAVMMGRTAYMGWLGRESKADAEAVNFALQKTSLESLADRKIASLSGGEQQRVLLARALAQSTPMLLLDEPTNHLDLQHQANLLALVRQLARESDLIVMMALHDLNLVALVADQVALMIAGQIQRVGSPNDVLIPDVISAAYETPVEIIYHPVTGAPIIFPGEILNSK